MKSFKCTCTVLLLSVAVLQADAKHIEIDHISEQNGKDFLASCDAKVSQVSVIKRLQSLLHPLLTNACKMASNRIA